MKCCDDAVDGEMIEIEPGHSICVWCEREEFHRPTSYDTMMHVGSKRPPVLPEPPKMEMIWS